MTLELPTYDMSHPNIKNVMECDLNSLRRSAKEARFNAIPFRVWVGISQEYHDYGVTVAKAMYDYADVCDDLAERLETKIAAVQNGKRTP